MLRSVKDLVGYTIGATDGNIGHVKDFLFDDNVWVIRYFVVETGAWLLSRKVLISPIAIHKPNWAEKLIPVEITQEQVKNSPDIDTERPVSRQHEIDYLSYYGFPNYWAGSGIWGGGMSPIALYPGLGGFRVPHNAPQDANQDGMQDDPHLRSSNAIVGYHVHATDGDIGHVSGLLVDEKTWAIRYLVVTTNNWGLGHQTLIAPEWIDEVRWNDETVSIDLSCQSVKDAPNYDSAKPLNRQREVNLYLYYERSGYWPTGETNEQDSAVEHVV